MDSHLIFFPLYLHYITLMPLPSIFKTIKKYYYTLTNSISFFKCTVIENKRNRSNVIVTSFFYFQPPTSTTAMHSKPTHRRSVNTHSKPLYSSFNTILKYKHYQCITQNTTLFPYNLPFYHFLLPISISSS